MEGTGSGASATRLSDRRTAAPRSPDPPSMQQLCAHGPNLHFSNRYSHLDSPPQAAAPQPGAVAPPPAPLPLRSGAPNRRRARRRRTCLVRCIVPRRTNVALRNGPVAFFFCPIPTTLRRSPHSSALASKSPQWMTMTRSFVPNVDFSGATWRTAMPTTAG